MKLADLSDVQLLESLKSLVGQARAVLARLLAHLVEVEERRLHLEAACPSMFQFCGSGSACPRTRRAGASTRLVSRTASPTCSCGSSGVSSRSPPWGSFVNAERVFGRQHVERRIRERRDPSQRGYSTESCALAASGLASMGFRPREVRRALEAVTARHPRETLAALSVQIVLREALAVLTPA